MRFMNTDCQKNGGALVEATKAGKIEILNLSFCVDGVCRREYFYLDKTRAKIMGASITSAQIRIAIKDRINEN
jgi:hypothetical protein